MGNGGEWDGRGGGGGGGRGFRNPYEAVGGEDEKTGFEKRESWKFIGFEVDRGEERAFDFVREEDRSAACG